MDIQRLLTLTTGMLHTKIQYVYEDIQYLTGVRGIMTHEIPNALQLLKPYLREVVADPRFWNGVFDPNHVGEIEVPQMSEEMSQKFVLGLVAMDDFMGGDSDGEETISK